MIEAVLPFPHIDPVLVHLGPLAIRWYALSYIAGLLLGWWYLVRLIRTPSLWTSTTFGGRPPATADDIGDLVVWATLGVTLASGASGATNTTTSSATPGITTPTNLTVFGSAGSTANGGTAATCTGDGTNPCNNCPSQNQIGCTPTTDATGTASNQSPICSCQQSAVYNALPVKLDVANTTSGATSTAITVPACATDSIRAAVPPLPTGSRSRRRNKISNCRCRVTP